jgi:hypothetical protein
VAVSGESGLISPTWRFETFAPVIAALPADLSEQDVLRPELLLHREGRLELYYAPFDWVNASARIVIVGITPGRHQMYVAIQQAQRGLAAGLPVDELLRQASATAAFAGSMRTNLVRMLDEIGVADALDIESTASMFAQDRQLLNSTSAVMYCAVRDGRNYSGSNPTISRSPILRAFATQVLARTLAATPGALVVPLGRYAGEAVDLAAGASALNLGHCLVGFPHPSGGNGHRTRLFAQHRENLARTVATWSGA